MKILRRYLAKQIYVATAVVLAAFLALFAFFDLLGELERVGQDGYTLKHAFMFVALTMPSRAYEILPIGVLIGSLFSLTQFARHSEMTVIRTAGVSTWRLVRILIGIGCVLALLAFVLGEFIAPPLDRLAQNWRLPNGKAAVAQALRSGTWLRDGHLFINAAVVNRDAGMEGIRIYEFDSSQNLQSISEAKQGRYNPQQGVWHLHEVVQTRFLSNKVEVEHKAESEWKSVLTPELVSAIMLVPERMSIRNLYPYIDYLKDNKQKTSRYEIAFWKKVVYPFTSIVMLILSLPFAYTHYRAGAMGARVLAGVMIGMGFHLLNSLFSNLGMLDNWPPLFAVMSPSLLFCALAMVGLWWVGRR